MLRFLYTAIFVFLYTCAPAQDYLLFRPGVQYLYENPTYVDQRSAISTQYYGVRIDTLAGQQLYTSLIAEGTIGEGECVEIVPSPFGYSIEQDSSGTIMDFGDMGSLRLLHAAPLGTRWVVGEPTDAVTEAEITAVNEGEVIEGLTDSLKTITFYGVDPEIPVGAPAVISKRYGLVSGPRFYRITAEPEPLVVAGMSEQSLGLQLPEQEDYTAVTVGDVFQYSTTRAGGGNDLDRSQVSAEIVSVDSVSEDRTVFTYRADILTYTTSIQDSTQGRDSTLVLDSLLQATVSARPEELAMRQPGATQLISEGNYQMALLYDDGPCALTNRFSTVAQFEPDDTCGLNDAALDGAPDQPYTANVPFLLEDLTSTGGPFINRLLYLNTANQECGTRLELADIIISTRNFDQSIDQSITIFPNPARNQLSVRFTEDIGVDELRLYNLAGSQVQSLPVGSSAGMEVNTSWLPTGTYFLLLYKQGLPIARRRLVVH